MSSPSTDGADPFPRVQQKADHLTIVQADASFDFHYVWLRHNCTCIPGCRHPLSLEPIVDPADVDPSVHPLSTRCDPSSTSPSAYTLLVEWSDGHHSSFDSTFLTTHAYSVYHPSDVELLSPSDPTFPHLSHATASPSQFLHSLRTYGCIIVRDGPRTPAATLSLVQDRLSASLIETYFGTVEDLRPINTTNANNDQLGLHQRRCRTAH